MSQEKTLLDDKLLRNYRFSCKGYSIISTEPVTINGVLYVRCPNKHSFTTTYVQFKEKLECLECNKNYL